jgi:ferrous iron transport protein B
MKTIFLIGNPNVGKSTLFSRLTGVHVIASNYPGTTVEYSKGYMRIKGEKAEVIDVPGSYSLEPNSQAEKVALNLFTNAAKNNDAIFINVIDATNLERNLNLTLQLIKHNVPIILALNFWDETKHVGVHIDTAELENIIDAPVVTTSAITGEGIKNLVSKINQARISQYKFKNSDIWIDIGQIITNTQTLSHRHHTFFERIEDVSIHPLAGIPVAFLILFFSFALIRIIGESLISYIIEPIFENLWAPIILKLSDQLGQSGLLHNILVGRITHGEVDFVESLGLLTTGLFVPIGMVLPYIIAFYLLLSFLEDSGYLPRLGVLVDNLMHKIGIHGLAIIPTLLGIGCNVPGAMATRILETKRERFIASTLMAIAVPCMAQIAMIFGLVGHYGIIALLLVFGTLFLVWITLGLILNNTLPGESPEIFVEIPPYRLPYFKALIKKMWMRTRWFLREAVPFVLLGVLIVNLLYFLHIIDFVGNITAPIISGIMGLPKDAVGAILVGFLRKDVAVGMLIPLGLTMKQIVIASIILTMYFPCIATFTVLIKELGVKDMVKAFGIMLISTLIVGGSLNFLL